MKKLILLMFAICTVFLGCNPKMNPESYSAKPQTFDAQQELVAASFSYRFSENGCDTGAQHFTDHARLCAALIDDAFNHWCAWQERHDKYSGECE